MSDESTHTTKRRKPWYRLRNIVLAIVAVLAVGIGYVVFETVELMTAQSNPTRDYRSEFVAEMLAHTGADSERAQRAYDHMLDALELYETMAYANLPDPDASPRFVPYEPRFAFDDAGYQFGAGLLGQNVHPLLDREREFLADLEDTTIFRNLDQLIALSPAIDQRPRQGMLLESLLPHLGRSRDVSKMLLFRARLALEEGDEARAAQSIMQTLAMANAVSHEESLIARLVAIANETMATSETMYAIEDYELSEATCVALIDAFERFELSPVRFAVQGEKVIALDWIQHCFTDDGEGDGFMCAPMGGDLIGADFGRERTLAEVFYMRFFGPRRAELTAIAEAHFDYFFKELEKPLIERWKTPQLMPAPEEMGAAGRMFHVLAPALERALENATGSEVVPKATIVALQLERFRARTGREPESLEEVERELNITLPVDPLNGGPFLYRRLSEPDEFGRTYLLYTTGHDQSDDGGVEMGEGDHRRGRFAPLLETALPGYDFVFNAPREPWLGEESEE